MGIMSSLSEILSQWSIIRRLPRTTAIPEVFLAPGVHHEVAEVLPWGVIQNLEGCDVDLAQEILPTKLNSPELP